LINENQKDLGNYYTKSTENNPLYSPSLIASYQISIYAFIWKSCFWEI